MAKQSNGRLWCRPFIGAQRYEVRLVPPDDERLAGKDALCIWQDTLILIRSDLSPERAEEALGHEVFVHALFEAIGLDREMWMKLEITETRWRAIEEDLACRYAPGLLATLKVNGWARLPSLPGRRTRSSVAPAAAKRRSK